MPVDLSPVIAATTQWLTRAYPPPGGVLGASLAKAQVRQAATVAAWLRYPTAMDVELLTLTGPGGSARLDWVAGVDHTGMDGTGRGDTDRGDTDPGDTDPGDGAWRTWVDEVVASWATCLLANPALAAAAVAALAGCEHRSGLGYDFRRLTTPDDHDRQAAVLLRHPDLVAPVADLHRPELMARLRRSRDSRQDTPVPMTETP